MKVAEQLKSSPSSIVWVEQKLFLQGEKKLRTREVDVPQKVPLPMNVENVNIIMPASTCTSSLKLLLLATKICIR